MDNRKILENSGGGVNDICLILPYYGRFPNYFDKWLKSAKKNNFIDFYILNDVCESHIDGNIRYIQMPLGEIKNRIEQRVGYSVCLKTPYKLCDYKPAYGDCFSDIISQYGFWGYVDPDVIFGDLRLILNPENMKKYGVIGCGGWLTVLKSTRQVNQIYKMELPHVASFLFREASQTNNNMYFDEWGFRRILEKSDIKVMDFYSETCSVCADVFPYVVQKAISIRFCDYPIYAKYDSGQLTTFYRKDGVWKERPNALIHLQKRYMNNYSGKNDSFLMVDNSFLPISMEDEIRAKFCETPEPLAWTGAEDKPTRKIIAIAQRIDKLFQIGIRPLWIRFIRRSKKFFIK